MAQGATMYVFEVRLADADRNVYETLTIRTARHPSETAEYLADTPPRLLPRVHGGHCNVEGLVRPG